jgi:cytochrome P450
MTVEKKCPMDRYEGLARNFDVHNPELNKCVFETLAYIREQAPIYRADTYGGHWLIVGHEEVGKAARDWRHFTNTQGVVIGDDKPQKFIPEEYDPPLHSSFRQLLNPFFSRRAGEALKEPLSAYADRLIDGFKDKGKVDLTEEYAMPIASHVFFELLFNFSPAEAAFCATATNDAMFSNDDELRASGFRRLKEFATDLVERRRGKPSDGGVIDTLRTSAIRVQGESRPITEDETIGAIQLLIIGGDDTSVHAMGDMLVVLASNAEVKQRIIADMSLMPQAVEESIRLMSPAVQLARTVVEDIEFEGVPLRAGDKMTLMWGSANRDAKVFENPDVFDLDRANLKQHLAFGAGPHRCIGEWFARAIVSTAAERLLMKIPDFVLDVPHEEIAYRMGQSRGPVSVPVRFNPPAG